MFRGNHQTRVDEKFRLKLPAEFKRRVDEVYGPLFYITSVDGRRAVEMDGQGRLLLPPVIRQTAKLAGEVNVLGMQTVLEVVNAEMFEAAWKGPDGVVEMARPSRAALAEKMKALKQ